MNRPATFWPLGVSIAVAVVLGLTLSFCVHAQVQVERPEIALDATKETRYRALLPDLRCLVCQNQSIADSAAPLAVDLRYEVREQLAAGRSDREIKRYLTARYGDFVLFRPPFNPVTGLLWLGPFLLAGLAALWVLRAARRSRRSAAGAGPATPDPQALQRLLAADDARAERR